MICKRTMVVFSPCAHPAVPVAVRGPNIASHWCPHPTNEPLAGHADRSSGLSEMIKMEMM